MAGSNGNGSGGKRIEQEFPVDIHREAEALPLRRDMATFLEFVRDNKVVGTKSSGNLPRKAIREITAHFVEPPMLDEVIGDRTYLLQSEYEVWPVRFLHVLAEVGNLVLTAPGRRWYLTPQGCEFLELKPIDQVMFLLSTWWFQANWLAAYPSSDLGEMLPDFFEIRTLEKLLAYPVGETISIKEFASDLIESTGLKWADPDARPSPFALRQTAHYIVIRILESFGVIEIDYRFREKVPSGRTISGFDTFHVTAFGWTLLDALYDVLDSGFSS